MDRIRAIWQKIESSNNSNTPSDTLRVTISNSQSMGDIHIPALELRRGKRADPLCKKLRTSPYYGSSIRLRNIRRQRKNNGGMPNKYDDHPNRGPRKLLPNIKI